MEQSVRKTYLNAVPVLSLVTIVLISVLGDSYKSIPQWTQFIIFGVLVFLNVAAFAIRYRHKRAEMWRRLIMLGVFLIVAAAITLYQLIA